MTSKETFRKDGRTVAMDRRDFLALGLALTAAALPGASLASQSRDTGGAGAGKPPSLGRRKLGSPTATLLAVLDTPKRLP